MSRRLLYLIGFLCIIVLLSISLYLQFFRDLIPCPLCTLQRICFGILGILFLLGILFSEKVIARFTLNIIAFLTSCAGIFFSGRQIWLQFFAKNAGGECLISFNYMVKILSIKDVLKKIFESSPDCTERGFAFLSLDLAEWALIWFIFFAILSLFLLFYKKIR